MEKLTQYQQGDVLAQQVRALPKGAVPVNRKGVLMEGELTGHAHVAVADDVRLYMVGDVLYAELPGGSEVVHEEHLPQTWKPGIYRINRVREKDHLADMVRPVID